MSDWPTLSEELERKTIQSLARSHNMHQTGFITDTVYRARLEVVLEITQGLVSSDYADATSDMLSKLPAASDAAVRIFQIHSSLIIGIRTLQGVKLMRFTGVDQPEVRQLTDGTSAKDDKAAFDRIIAKGLEKGKELL